MTEKHRDPGWPGSPLAPTPLDLDSDSRSTGARPELWRAGMLLPTFDLFSSSSEDEIERNPETSSKSNCQPSATLENIRQRRIPIPNFDLESSSESSEELGTSIVPGALEHPKLRENHYAHASNFYEANLGTSNFKSKTRIKVCRKQSNILLLSDDQCTLSERVDIARDVTIQCHTNTGAVESVTTDRVLSEDCLHQHERLKLSKDHSYLSCEETFSGADIKAQSVTRSDDFSLVAESISADRITTSNGTDPRLALSGTCNPQDAAVSRILMSVPIC